VIDTWFVGQLGGAELAALGFATSLYFFVVALFMGLADGTSALVGSALGNGNRTATQGLTSSALGLAGVAAGLMATFGILWGTHLFTWLGAEPQIAALGTEYMDIMFAGVPVLTLTIVGNAGVRAAGDAVRPEAAMVMAGIVILVLDAVLIFGLGPIPALGMASAALATVISWSLAALVTVWLLRKHQLFRIPSVAEAKNYVREIVAFSTPAVMTQMLVPLSAMILTVLAARSGAAYVAAVGVATRVETLSLVGISALAVAVVPAVAQNHGARDQERVHALLRVDLLASAGCGLLAALLLTPLAGPIARIFTDDPEIVTATATYLQLVAWSYPAAGVVSAVAASLNGLQQPKASLGVLAVRTLVFAGPLMVLGAWIRPEGLFAGLALGNHLGGITAYALLQRNIAAHDAPPLRLRKADN